MHGKTAKAKTVAGDMRAEPAPRTSTIKRRVETTMQTAASLGLTQGRKERRLSWRANDRLVQAAQKTCGLEGSDLLEYALAKVALEDDFVETFLALRGTVDADIDLEF